MRCVRFLPLTPDARGGQSGSAGLSWRPALHLPRARLARPDSPASSVGPRPARVRPGARPRPGPAVGASAPPGELPRLAARPPERSVGRSAREEASDEIEGWPGQAVALAHGRQAADPYGQREAQQEYHPARQRRQDLGKGRAGASPFRSWFWRPGPGPRRALFPYSVARGRELDLSWELKRRVRDLVDSRGTRERPVMCGDLAT